MPACPSAPTRAGSRSTTALPQCCNGLIYRLGGVLPDYDSDTVRIYYGGADTCMCLATAGISDLIAFAKSG
jgi:hypothetical protein